MARSTRWMAAQVANEAPSGCPKSFGTRGRLPRSVFARGTLLTGKRSRCTYSLSAGNPSAVSRLGPSQAGAPCSGTPCPSVDRSSVGPWRCRKTATGRKVELMDNLLREFLTEICESLDTRRQSAGSVRSRPRNDVQASACRFTHIRPRNR